MTRGRPRWPVLLIGGVVAVAILVLWVNTIPPAVPGDAATTAVARTSGKADDNGCVDRITVRGGWIDPCWAVSRVTAEADPGKDYYVLKLFATYEGLRWGVFATDLVGEPGDGAYSMWPRDDMEAECRSMPVDMGPVPNPPIETLCGPLTVDKDFNTWTERVVWTCSSCLLPNTSRNSISLYSAVGVPAGTIPSWDLFADGGG